MDILSRIGTITQPYFAATSEMFRKSPENLLEPIPIDSDRAPTKLPPNPTPPKPDCRKQPRSLKQIETYKKNFGNRHKPKPKPQTVPTTRPSVYDKIFS